MIDIDALKRDKRPQSAWVVHALIDRLEAAEKERDDVAQQLVQSEQGKRKISKECESYKAAYNDWADKTEWVQQGFNEGTISAKYFGLHRADVMARLLDEAEKERDVLKAKIERMERQEPVGEIRRANSTGNYINPVVWVPMAVGAKLYALPGAKGEGK